MRDLLQATSAGEDTMKGLPWPSSEASSWPESWAGLPQSELAIEVARRISVTLLARGGTAAGHLGVMLDLARNLRGALAQERSCAEAGQPTSLRLRLEMEIAYAIGCTLPQDCISTVVADLRLFAHLTLGECADLLGCERDELDRCWQPTRRVLFALVRDRLGRPRRPSCGKSPVGTSQ